MSEVLSIGDLPKLRMANKAQLAEFFGVSLPTIGAWVRRGCPVREKGSNGRPWVFDALAVAEWRFSSGDESAAAADPDSMSPQDRKAWYESEVKRRDLQVRDGALIPAEDAERWIPRAFSAIAQDLLAIPDNLERRCGVSGEAAESVEVAIHEALTALAERLESLATVTE